MENIFTIAGGLEIMGALKTRGHGSVYKGRRNGDLISAVKLLPDPGLAETGGKDYLANIEQELSKLKKLGENPHQNVVKIFDAGISRELNLPFIEMEFIDGLDLEKLSQPPYDLIFSVKETINVAEQLCNALDHCHRLEVIHGDLKSINIKFNRHTGNYVLVDFGLAAIPEEQRRTSLLNSSGTEFTAPEQQYGKLLYQTDVYSFGLILFKLLAGSFPSFSIGNVPTARNGTPAVNSGDLLSDLLSLRIDKVPASWSEEDKKREMFIPKWLVSLVYKCLETNPKKRFATGMQVREYLTSKNKSVPVKAEPSTVEADELRAENQRILLEKAELEKALEMERFNDKIMYRQWKELNEIVTSKDRELKQLKQKIHRPSISPARLFWMLLAAIFIGAFFSYSLFSNIIDDQTPAKQIATSKKTDTATLINNKQTQQQVAVNSRKKQNKDTLKYQQPIPSQPKAPTRDKKSEYPVITPADTITYTTQNSAPVPDANLTGMGEYKVKSKAYLYDRPNRRRRTDTLIVHGNNETVEALDEQNGFIYIVYTNHSGQTCVGWLKKRDLTRID